ncbi:uncharacterized protein B0T15DRAFT_59216 [Chaetomium strumarium]|uniref:Uncharacterized protein n=1 Tax=Chaetomium strumarium TaxID=1170767 RepID=A0AAJ0H3F8_9PEZI|nr:hypothetical protein B0T15DRAFT_59216 [Chaetomium strumarium]
MFGLKVSGYLSMSRYATCSTRPWVNQHVQVHGAGDPRISPPTCGDICMGMFVRQCSDQMPGYLSVDGIRLAPGMFNLAVDPGRRVLVCGSDTPGCIDDMYMKPTIPICDTDPYMPLASWRVSIPHLSNPRQPTASSSSQPASSPLLGCCIPTPSSRGCWPAFQICLKL